MDIVNNKEIRIFGIKRSGNHAIINWLFRQIPGKVVFLNNCYPAGKNLRTYEGIGTIECKGIDYWDFKKKLFLFERNPFANQETICYSREDRRLDRQQLKQHIKEAIIISFEDRDINKMNAMLDNKHNELIGLSGETFYFIILRDPFNLFSSIYKKWGEEHLIRVLPVWKEYAKMFLSYERNPDSHFNGINYNQWVVDKVYRKRIVEKIQIPFDDSGKKQVSRFGRGSSFDELSYGNNAEQMDVLSRWKTFEQDPKFRACFKDSEIIELARQIFGIISGTEAFIDSL